MKRLEITLKSGAVVTGNVTKWTVSTNPISGAVTKLEWTTPRFARRRLVYVKVDDIAGVVER